jgi:excisionase family DNA binding protein
MGDQNQDFKNAADVNPEPKINSHLNLEQRLTIKETADLLGLGVSTTYKLIKQGVLPPPEKWGKASRQRLGSILAAAEKLKQAS